VISNATKSNIGATAASGIRCTINPTKPKIPPIPTTIMLISKKPARASSFLYAGKPA